MKFFFTPLFYVLLLSVAYLDAHSRKHAPAEQTTIMLELMQKELHEDIVSFAHTFMNKDNPKAFCDFITILLDLVTKHQELLGKLNITTSEIKTFVQDATESRHVRSFLYYYVVYKILKYQKYLSLLPPEIKQNLKETYTKNQFLQILKNRLSYTCNTCNHNK